MRKFYIFGLVVLAVTIIGFAWAEQITLTTYYPAPYGVYRQFTTTSKTTLATNLLSVDPDASVGIGTDSPDPNTKLEVQGGPVKTTDGLIIETIDGADPSELVNGRIWLRLDINL